MTTAAPLLNTPNDPNSFEIWAFELSQNIDDINAAILAQQNVRLPRFPIYPVPIGDLGTWLLQISEAIGNITGLLKIQNEDVENVDLNDAAERQAWTFSIFSELRQARIVLKI